jgi:hypothetical protein
MGTVELILFAVREAGQRTRCQHLRLGKTDLD